MNLALHFLAAYLIGAVPIGLIIGLFQGKDVTNKEMSSGRTGATNVARVVGTRWGVISGILDLLKGFIITTFFIGTYPEQAWIQVWGGVLCVLGHCWSIWYLLWTFIKKRPSLGGGAGTGPNIGAAMAFWQPIVFFTVPVVIYFVLLKNKKYAMYASSLVAINIPIIFILLYACKNRSMAHS